MKRSLMRPTDVLLPLAGIAAALATDTLIPSTLFFLVYMLQVFSLCAVDAFRNAAAREPGLRRVDKRFGGAFPQILLGIGLSIGFCWLMIEENTEMMNLVAMLGAAACVVIEQLFEERLHAIGRSVDVKLMALLSSMLLCAGMVLDGIWDLEPPLQGIFTLCGAGLGLLVEIINSFALEPVHGYSLVPRNLGFVPKAAVQSLLYPVAMCALMLMQARRGEKYIDALEEYLALPLIIGMIPWRLSRTVCRRASDESRPLNLLLVSIAALAVIAHAALEMWDLRIVDAELVHICADGLVLALVCAIIVFCAPGWRLYAGAALVMIAGSLGSFYIPHGEWIAMGLCVIAVVLNLKKAFLRKV